MCVREIGGMFFFIYQSPNRGHSFHHQWLECPFLSRTGDKNVNLYKPGDMHVVKNLIFEGYG